MEEAERAFGDTTKIIFGKALRPLDKYEKWLRQNIPACKIISTSEGPIIMPNISIYRLLPEERMAGLEYREANSKKKLEVFGVDGDCKSLAEVSKEFGKIERTVCELREGTNHNMIGSNFYLNCQNCYRIAFCFYSKSCAYSIWSSFNDHSFGCYRNMNSSFSVNCYFSAELSRCFEMDACKKCSGSMFCHNVENVHDSMFCFNAKNLRYAVANVEVGRDRYTRLKAIFVGQMLEELEATGGLTMGIYNILARRSNALAINRCD